MMREKSFLRRLSSSDTNEVRNELVSSLMGTECYRDRSLTHSIMNRECSVLDTIKQEIIMEDEMRHITHGLGHVGTHRSW